MFFINSSAATMSSCNTRSFSITGTCARKFSTKDSSFEEVRNGLLNSSACDAVSSSIARIEYILFTILNVFVAAFAPILT